MNFTRRAALAAAATLPVLASHPAKAARFTLKLGADLVDTHPGILRSREAAEAIRWDTQGEVELRIFPDNQLGSAQEMLNQVRSGAVDFYPAAAAGLSALVPAAGISSMGFAFSDYGRVWAAMDGRLGELIRSEIGKSGTIFAFDSMWDNGFRQMTNSARPIQGPADLAGIKMRVPIAPLYTSMFSALGASPTGLSIAELYTSLQTKLVDGQDNPLTIVDLYKFYEVQKYCSLTNHMWDGWWLLGNQRSWNRLPGDARTVVAKHMNEAALAMRSDVVALNEGVTARLSSHGLAINAIEDPLAFRRALSGAGFYAGWRKTYGEAAWEALEAAAGPLA